MLKLQSCPQCYKKGIELIKGPYKGQFNGKTYIVPYMEYWSCKKCGEKVYDREAMQQIQKYSPAYKKNHRMKKIA